MKTLKKFVTRGANILRNLISAHSSKPISRSVVHIPTPNEERFFPRENENHSQPDMSNPSSNGFDLSRLKSLFEANNIDICAYDALYHLLNAIEKASYINTLKTIVDKATTPADLIAFSDSQMLDRHLADFSFEQGGYGPWVAKEYVQNLCREKGVSFTDSVDDSIKTLFAQNVQSGANQFNVFFGHRIQLMKECMIRGEDVAEQFSTIMNKIKEKIH